MRAALPVLLPALLGAMPLWAECLGARDLGRGVLVSYDNGDEVRLQRTADGAVTVDETYADGSVPMRLHAARGIYYFEEYMLDEAGRRLDGTGLRVEFPSDPRSLPEPAAGLVWEGETVNVFPDGSERRETVRVRFEEGAPLVLSGCTYALLDTAIRYDWGKDGGLTLRYAYLPELGAGLVLTSQFDGGEVNAKTPVALTRAGK